jgi:aminoglycoside phosphotransferase (APT) family kinase protein
LSARVLKHVPGKRCVIAYERADGARLVAKMYRKDRAPRHAAILQQLSAVLCAATRTPGLVDCWADWGLVVETWVPGAAAPDWSALAHRPDLLQRLGAALAELHAAPVDDAPAANLEAHVRRTCHPGVEALAMERQELGAAAQQLRRLVLERDRIAPPETATCHGDFGPAQIFVAGGTVSLVDLDGLCRSNPALDVANFRVGLETHAGLAGRDAGARFLAAYREQCGRELAALRVYEAFCDLRRAMIAWRKQPPGWEAECGTMLQRGLARL